MPETLVLSTDLFHKLRHIRDQYNDRVAMAIVHRSADILPDGQMPDNYWDYRVDDGDWTYMPGQRISAVRDANPGTPPRYLEPDLFFKPERISLRVKTRPGRAVRRMLESMGIIDTFSDDDLSRFVDNWRAGTVPTQVDIVSGDDVLDAYKGVDGSCMSYGSCRRYLRVYANTAAIRLAVVYNKDKTPYYGYGGEEAIALGRALVWDFGDFVMMDRQYGDYGVKRALAHYGRENGWLVRDHDRGEWILPDGRVVDRLPDEYWDMGLNVGAEWPYMPYGDTMSHWCQSCGWLSRRASGSGCVECGESPVVLLNGTRGDDHDNWDAWNRCEGCERHQDECCCTECEWCGDYFADYDGYGVCPHASRCGECGNWVHHGQSCDRCESTWCDVCDARYRGDECPTCNLCPTCNQRDSLPIVDDMCSKCALTYRCNCGYRSRPMAQLLEIAKTYGADYLGFPAWGGHSTPCYGCSKELPFLFMANAYAWAFKAWRGMYEAGRDEPEHTYNDRLAVFTSPEQSDFIDRDVGAMFRSRLRGMPHWALALNREVEGR